MSTAKRKVPASPEIPVEKLWKRYLKGRDIDDRNKLVENYAPLVQAHAGRLSKKLPATVSFDEICSAAYDGLIEAVEAFDPARKARFETFCQQRIRGAVMDWLRTLDGQSRTVRSFEKRVSYMREILDAEQGRTPTNKEIAARMGITAERFEYLTRLSQLGREVHFSSLEAHGSDNGRANFRFWDVGDQRQEDPSRSVSRQMLTEYLTRGLSREERLVLILYYFEELTMAEIGSILNLSESRVSQIHKDVLNRLRKRVPSEAATELVA
jgi:RNA polymerase sigma factor for flagellar operon FliA